MSTKIHHGTLLEKAIQESGISKSALAGKMNVSRPTLYSLFRKEIISADLLYKIGYLINHDFSGEVSRPEKELPEKRSAEKEAAHWMDKYVELLEEHTVLLFQLLSKP